MHDDYSVTPSEIDSLLKSLPAGFSTCRHMRIIEPHKFHTSKVETFDRIEIRLPTAILRKIVCDNFRSCHTAYG